jgi:hypothetical protein
MFDWKYAKALTRRAMNTDLDGLKMKVQHFRYAKKELSAAHQ